jgi:transposase
MTLTYRLPKGSTDLEIFEAFLESNLPPYSPEFNPNEGFFSKLNAFIKRNLTLYVNVTDRSCGDEVGTRSGTVVSARGHFTNACIDVDGTYHM